MKNEIKEHGLAHIETLNEVLFMTSHKVRKPVATCLGLMSLLNPNCKREICTKELEMIFAALKPSILELDEYIKELTSYVACARLKEDARVHGQA